MNIAKRAKFIIITTSLISIISWSGFFELQKLALQAQTPFVFGGPIANVEVCTCSGSLNVMVVDYSKIPILPVNYLYIPGVTILYPFFQIFRSGPWTLGTYLPGAVCLMAGPTICTPSTLPPIGTMIMVGTSI